MVRVVALRVGYAALGLAILALAGGTLPALGSAVLLSPVLALAGAGALLFSRDDLPRWAGVASLAYFLLTFLAFLAATPATIRLSFWKGFANDDPSPLFEAITEYLVLALPVMVCATALAAAWEREHGARLLLGGALAGLVVLAVLTVALVPAEPDVQEGETQPSEVVESASRARTQGRLLNLLLALSAAAGAAGAFWAAARPDEFHPGL